MSASAVNNQSLFPGTINQCSEANCLTAEEELEIANQADILAAELEYVVINVRPDPKVVDAYAAMDQVQAVHPKFEYKAFRQLLPEYLRKITDK